MKKLFAAVIVMHFLNLQADPLVVAVLMVKNEEPVMAMTLKPLVDAGFTDFFIYDTGSTDNTIAATEQFFKESNISNFVIEQGEWIDFSTSRNRALDLTEQYFPQATFMLMLDAEWILHHGDDLLNYCKQHKNDVTTLYMIQLKGTNVEFGHARLFKCGSNVRFFGKVHEIPNVPAQARIPNYIYFELSPTHYGKEKSKTRWLRDRDILLKEVLNNPGDGRSVIFLAQTYFGLEDYENAAKWYEYRLKFPGFAEEIFLAYFCLAQAYSAMNNTPKMISNYLKAYSFRSHRADPLIRLAEYFFINEQYHLCYLFAKASVTMPYPTQDVAIVEKRLYDFVRYDLLSKVCTLYHDYALGEMATEKALEVEPNLEYLHCNLQYYRSMLHAQTKGN